ncbi:Rhs element Vgr family protein [Yersinia aldovae 670-83]|nr:type VI secretion system tip protein VgrG [Yersinia aldovae]AJJ63871.1 Rhs element Vgr family protein [Yersinia aldovae 670-83]
MFADDKKANVKGSVKPNNTVTPDAAATLSGEQVVGMAGGLGDVVGGTAGKRVNQAADLAKTALDAKAKVLDGGIVPTNAIAGKAPTLSGGTMAGMSSGVGAALPGASALAAAIKQPSGLQFTLTTAGLAPQTFVVVDFSLSEMLSSPFVLNVGLASADPSVDFAAVLDEDATLFVWRDGVLQRSVTGMVASFEQGDTGFHQTRYSMVIRPALWRTSLRRNSRIFQQESIESITTTLLKENGINDFAFGFRNPHPAREFCVQYQESDFDFIQRLTAEEGIFYYFEFSAGKNTIVYADDVGSLPKGASLPYNPNVAAQAQELCVTTFTRSAQVRPAMVQLKDYTFKNPNWSAAFSEQSGELQNQRPDYEHFDFPGRFKDEQHGQDFTRYRLEALRNDANLGQGESNDFTLQPGQLFSLTNHPRSDLNHSWQLLGVQHTGKQMQALEQESGDQGTVLFNHFSFIPPTQTWRPTPLPKPAMDGPQIAMVVGPPGEEIYCDEFGRIRLQFLWDRYGQSNDNSSCWIRVTQPWAGQGWGMLAIPRIGQEVVVDFLHGDPDQPIVTGRTYHANNIPPGSLPASKTQMAFRSKTHKGEGFNEMRFEDAKGGEGLFLHAQKDMTTTVKNDQNLTVESGNRTLNILAGNESKTVKQGGLSENVCTMRSTDANQVQVKAKAGKSGAGTQLYEASDDITLKVGAGEIKMTTSSIVLKFAGSSIQLDAGGIFINGPVINLNK